MNSSQIPCFHCHKQISFNEKAYSIYEISLAKDSRILKLPLDYLLAELNNWAVYLGLHLSASELVLFRADIMESFFKERYVLAGENYIGYTLIVHNLCHSCYKEKIKQFPAR